ncbi:hypothetical protein HOK09_04575 [Candidatus Woesearchaeota archaeon]|jgi:hypothetical protein|nr:hypothetical protein [Candidatus Woesearchaeota archaeon]
MALDKYLVAVHMYAWQEGRVYSMDKPIINQSDVIEYWRDNKQFPLKLHDSNMTNAFKILELRKFLKKTTSKYKKQYYVYDWDTLLDELHPLKYNSRQGVIPLNYKLLSRKAKRVILLRAMKTHSLFDLRDIQINPPMKKGEPIRFPSDVDGFLTLARTHFYNDLVNTNLITAFATTETKKGAITDDMLDNVTEWLNHLIKSKKEYEEYQESFERIL